jgi:hypothetical protein
MDETLSKKLKASGAWIRLVAAVRDWSENHMDQWERFKFEGKHGPIYVSIRLEPDAPESAYDDAEPHDATLPSVADVKGILA